jgi:hypothetical protein
MQEDAFYQHQQQMIPPQYPWEFSDPNYLMSGQNMMAMPVAGYPVTYGPPNPFYHSQPVMHGSPLAYAPMTAQYSGSPGPRTSHGLQPSRLRTLTHGHLGVSRRRVLVPHPGRDYDTAIRQIAEGKREIAAHDAAWAAYDAQQAAEAAMSAQAAEVRRFTGGEDTSNGNTAYYDGYPANDGQYANGVQHAHVDYATGEYANGEHINGEYTNGEFHDSGYANGANGYGGYQ